MATVASLDKRLTALEARVKTAEAAIVSLKAADKAGVPWRKPVLSVAQWPATSEAVQGSIAWSFLIGAAAQPVSYSIDGGTKLPAPNPIAWGPLAAGPHHIELFLGASSVPEMEHSWSITTS